jgi:hypothetical protein
MAASPSQIAGSIGAGTTEYGQRQQLAADIQSATAGASAPSGTGPAPVGGSAGVGPGDPIGAMLSGMVTSGEDPLTSGLSVGPGAGPASPMGAGMDMQAKLLSVANNARSPQLRAQARQTLQRLVRSRRVS